MSEMQPPGTERNVVLIPYHSFTDVCVSAFIRKGRNWNDKEVFILEEVWVEWTALVVTGTRLFRVFIEIPYKYHGIKSY